MRCFHAVPVALLAIGLAHSAWSVEDLTETRLLDGFEILDPWKAEASDGVLASAHAAPGFEGGAMRLDFDFDGAAGYAYARRALPIELPENYEISFYIRADASMNDLQFKLIDGSGDNVWWFHRQNFEFPTDWQKIRIKKRQIEFAWGPTKDRTLKRAEQVEFTIVAGKGGGRGSVTIDQLAIRPLPPVPATFPTPIPEASSSLPDEGPERIFDADPATAWRSDPAAGKAQRMSVDLGLMREFGGLTLRWAEGAHASRYAVALSDNGGDWRVVRRVEEGNGGSDPLLLTESDARYIRLDLEDGPGPDYALAAIEIEDLTFGATPNAFIQALAKAAPRGRFPRGFSGEQAYWTLVGIDGGGDSGLISEDGAVELGKGGPSVEPFVLSGSRLHGWADVEISQSLREDYLPIPGVTWRHPDWELRVTTFAQGDPEQLQLVTRYQVSNRTDAPQRLALALAVRPFQVNPLTQFLNIKGGVSPIRSLAWEAGSLRIEGEPKVVPLTPPDRIAVSTFDAGSYPDRLLDAGNSTRAVSVEDETGFASGVLVYRLDLGPRENRTVGFVTPLSGALPRIDPIGPDPEAWLEAQENEVAERWRAKLNAVTLEVPPEGQRIVDTLRSTLAQILMSRDAQILKPGTRAYDRSWIRDGAMISESLLRLGHADIAADYLRWFAPMQFDNGKVPCCVDRRGPDPIPENDSQGELIFLAAELYRFTGDRALAEKVWPNVEAAARYMDRLRLSERTAANQTPDRRMLYGLMPPSISHEGYSAKPAYSYWDDFWSLRGYKDAVALARALGKTEALAWLTRSYDEFRADLMASLVATAEVHDIDYLAGAADLGDFDATSTTIALAPGGEQAALPSDLLRRTFERYWENAVARRDGKIEWTDYTPYELRNVGAFVRLGWRERASELLDFFFRDRRPEAWNQWAEVVGRSPRAPRFIGDMPHAWVASDYIRSALDMFVYEREADQALVLAAGVPRSWFEGEGFAANGLRTPHGQFDVSVRRRGGTMVLALSGEAAPPGGYVFPSPWPGLTPDARLNGEPIKWHGEELRVRASGSLELVIDLPDGGSKMTKDSPERGSTE